ncbi:MAG TPA: hypothetical protein VFC67_16050 [Prolixibacteraceae bacterium]|nr:hypothetical protein [Prolixibacteraceae bacterium]
MSKRLYTYAGFTATDLKNRASIPSQTDITVGSNYIDCSSVDIPSEIRDIIGEGSNDLGTIYMSAKVNKWSGFGPREWYVSGGLLLNRVKALPYDMANFCGYNHNAVTPGWMGGSYITDFKYVQTDNSKVLSGGLQGGEIDFLIMVGATHVKWVIKDPGGNVIGSSLAALGSYYNSNPIIPVCTITMGNWTGVKNLSSTIYLSNSFGDELCVYPGTTAWTIIATQRLNPAGAVLPSGSVIKIVAGSATLDLAGNYTITINNMTRYSMTPYTGRVNIVANLYNEVNGLIHTQQITTNDSARSFAGYLTHAADYDYHVEFLISNADA